MARPTPVLAWAVALLLGGAWMATQVPLEWAPTIELPEVRVTASWPGSSPRSVERYVTAPLERAVQNVEGTAGVESVSEEGRTTITAQVAEGTDLGLYTARVSERLRLVEESLPDRVTPRLTKRVPEALRDEQGFMTLQLVGPQEPAALRRLADDRVSPQVSSLPGVSDSRVRGGTTRELLVTLDPDRLAAHSVEAAAVRRALRAATSNAVYGRLRGRGRAPLLITPATERVEPLRTLVVSPPGRDGPPVQLRDVARVELTGAPRRSITRIDGNSVVTLTLDRAPGSHMVEVAERVRGRMERLEGTLPGTARLEVATDKSEDVRRQLHDLRWRGGVGLLLVILVLLLMLRSVRAVGTVLFTVAVALAVALALLKPLGLTLNLITLAGLVLVFGLLVDNSVIVTEQVLLQRERTPGMPLAQSADRAVRAVSLPLVGGTLTTIAVMLPLVYLSGELRELFLPFGVLTALTLAASLASAVILVPILAPEPEEAGGPGSPRRLPRWARRSLQWPYAIGTWAPKTTMAAVILLVGVPVWLLPGTLEPSGGEEEPSVALERLAPIYNGTVGSHVVREAREWVDPALGGIVRPFIRQTTFGETWDYEAEPEVSVRLGFPPGNPIERADSLLQRFEQTALASESVRRTVARITERNARLRVLFRSPALETAEPYMLRERLIQEAVLLAGIDVSVAGLLPQGYYSRSGTRVSGFTVVARGPNYEDLTALCERFARELKQKSRRVATVNTNASRRGFRQPREVLRFRLTPDAQARTGVTPRRLTSRLRPVLTNRRPALRADLEGAPQLPVRLVVEGARDLDVETLTDRPLTLAGSTQVKLKSASTHGVETVPSRIVRENQQYKRYVEVDFRGPHRMGDEFITNALEAFSTPPGYQVEREERTFFTEETERAFGWIILGTIVLVFLATAVVFESWRLPGVVLLSVPTALVGVAGAFLFVGDLAFAEGAFIGAVLLVGIAANDSILLVDRYQHLRRTRPHGNSGTLARLALRERLRPMWTTTLSTCVAMLPLLVFPQDGTFWTGMAVTVTGGLLAATLLAPLASVALMQLVGSAAE